MVLWEPYLGYVDMNMSWISRDIAETITTTKMTSAAIRHFETVHTAPMPFDRQFHPPERIPRLLLFMISFF